MFKFFTMKSSSIEVHIAFSQGFFIWEFIARNTNIIIYITILFICNDILLLQSPECIIKRLFTVDVSVLTHFAQHANITANININVKPHKYILMIFLFILLLFPPSGNHLVCDILFIKNMKLTIFIVLVHI